MALVLKFIQIQILLQATKELTRNSNYLLFIEQPLLVLRACEMYRENNVGTEKIDFIIQYSYKNQ